MATKVYGASDDLIEFEGDVKGEVGCYSAGDDGEPGVLLCFSDATVLEVKYGKDGEGIWGIRLLKRGSLLGEIETCTDADADPYSDVATFKDGLKWVYAATKWEKVR